MNCIRAALVGVSGYASFHYRGLEDMRNEGRVVWQAATVINQHDEPECCEALRKAGSRIYDDFSEMIARERGQVDLCCIPTGISLHRPMTVAALEAGMNVLVEKPVAGTLADALWMQEVRDRTGLDVFVGFQNMYAPSLWDIKERLVAGELGDILRVRIHVQWPRPQSYYTRNRWAGRLAIDGETILDSPANNAMAHFIMMALFWAGQGVEDTAHIESMHTDLFRAQEIESFDTFSARVLCRGGIELIVNMSHSSGQLHRPEVVVDGSKGTLRWQDDIGAVATFSGGGGFAMAPFEDTRLQMFRAVLDRMQGQASRVCSLDLAMGHTRFIEQVHATGRIIQVPEDWVTSQRIQDGETLFVPTLAEQLLEAHRQGQMLSESCARWRELAQAAPLEC